MNVAWKRRPRGNVATESYTRGCVEGAAGVAYVLGTRTGARCTEYGTFFDLVHRLQRHLQA
eukprot:5799052-Prymnesium_polylepis.1